MSAYRTLRAANAARQAEWDKDGKISLSYRGNELGGECGEAQNVIKKIERERLGIRGSRATVDDLAAELADVVICADLIALAEGIDLDAAVAAKFNATSEKVGLATRLKPNTADTELRDVSMARHIILKHVVNALDGEGAWDALAPDERRRLRIAMDSAILKVQVDG